MERDVIVREVGPRDGLQLVKETLPTDTKVNWIKAEAEAGMVEFEVCSFVPPHIIPQFADARAVAGRALEEIPGIRVMALSPNIKGAEIAFEVGVHVMNYVLSVSKTHNEANVRRSREQSVLDFAEIVKIGRTHLQDAVRRLEERLDNGSTHWQHAFDLASVHAVRGERDSAFRWLDTAYYFGFRSRALARGDGLRLDG